MVMVIMSGLVNCRLFINQNHKITKYNEMDNSGSTATTARVSTVR